MGAIVFFLLFLLFAGFLYRQLSLTRHVWRRRITLVEKAETPPLQCRAKPAWVQRELIKIKAHSYDSGCRAVADIFNRRFAAEKGVTVGKTFVASVLRAHMADILRIRKTWKRRIPKPVPRNLVWAMDLTGITDTAKQTRNILGIIDHGTRKCLSLKALGDKASITLLKILILAIESFGKPKAIRTDNEAVFTSRLFNFGLWLLGIRHQQTTLHCPWQNGRIERFFGTFKSVADRVLFEAQNFQISLNEFAFWYNHIRPHRHLYGRTPDEAWSGIDPYLQAPKSCRKFSAWDGMLTGFQMEYG